MRNFRQTCGNGLLVPLLFLSLSLTGQQRQADPEAFRQTNIQTNRIGMYSLGAWAVGNIGVGIYGWQTYSGEDKYFHQMNALWNTVNLGLAISGLIGSGKMPVEESALLAHSRRMERIFLINAGLDVLYMGSGVLLRQLQPETPVRQQQLDGYGRSLILQGAFLFVFDLAMYRIKKTQRNSYLETVSIAPASDALGLRLVYKW